ncbi:MAG: hypothetical protein R6V01_09830 [Thermoplasmatota archaeon]
MSENAKEPPEGLGSAKSFQDFANFGISWNAEARNSKDQGPDPTGGSYLSYELNGIDMMKPPEGLGPPTF